jgi:phosphoglycerate kinase
MRGIASVNVRGKRILLRLDLNVPIEEGKIVPGPRMQVHACTAKMLSDKGAKVIILAHQGRKGKPDFTSLEQHAKHLHHMMKKDVEWVDDITGPQAKAAISAMKDGDILVLDNVRKLDDDTNHDGKIVEELSPLADYFVLDALSVAHRNQASVTGFTKTLPSFAGPHLLEDVEALEKLKHSKDIVFVLGGSKVEDSFAIMKKWLRSGKARKVLVCGALATLMLHAQGHKVGDSMEFLNLSNMEAHCTEAKEMLAEFDDHIALPIDVGLSVGMERHDHGVNDVHRGQIWDIGPKTVEMYKESIFNSHTVVMNGPAGVYEMEAFSKGTRGVLEAIAQCDAFSLLGGGHTVTAVEKFGIEKRHFGHISLAGKALIEFLSGHELPGLKALEENEKKFPLKKG